MKIILIMYGICALWLYWNLRNAKEVPKEYDDIF